LVLEFLEALLLRASRAVSSPSEPVRTPDTDDTPLSVAYMCPGWPPGSFTNGIVTYVNAIGIGLRNRGHIPFVLTHRVAETGRDDPIHTVVDLAQISNRGELASRLGDRLLRLWRPRTARSRRLGRVLRRSISHLETHGGLDILEIEESFGWTRWVAGHTTVPVVVRLHGPWFLIGPKTGADIESQAFQRRVVAEGRGLQRADAITAPSRDVLEQTLAYYGLEDKPSAVIPNPIVIDATERLWRLEDAEPDRLLFIGRFDRLKGADTVIEAYARLREHRPQTRLTIVGPDRGINEKGHRRGLREYVEHRLPGALDHGEIEWLGQQPPSELNALRRRAFVTIIASRYENFPYVALESLAIGCPTVASAVGGIPEIVEDGKTGLLFRAGDPADLAATMAKLLQDPSRAARLGARAAERVIQRFTPEAVADQTVAFYQSTLEHRIRRHHPEHKEIQQ